MSRPCDICGRISNIPDDDYECDFCSVDFNECCRDEEAEKITGCTVCVECGKEIRE